MVDDWKETRNKIIFFAPSTIFIVPFLSEFGPRIIGGTIFKYPNYSRNVSFETNYLNDVLDR